MTFSEIMVVVSAMKYIVPAVEAFVSSIKGNIPQDKVDVQAAVAAIEKVCGDFKATFVALEAAIQAASESK